MDVGSLRCCSAEIGSNVFGAPIDLNKGVGVVAVTLAEITVWPDRLPPAGKGGIE